MVMKNFKSLHLCRKINFIFKSGHWYGDGGTWGLIDLIEVELLIEMSKKW